MVIKRRGDKIDFVKELVMHEYVSRRVQMRIEGYNSGKDDWNWKHLGGEVETQGKVNSTEPSRVRLEKTSIHEGGGA